MGELSEFLKYGIAGAAAVFAILSFWLVQQLISLPADEQRSKVVPVYMFMGLTIAFACLAIFSQWVNPAKIDPKMHNKIAERLANVVSSLTGTVSADISEAKRFGEGSAANSSDAPTCSAYGARAASHASSALAGLSVQASLLTAIAGELGAKEQEGRSLLIAIPTVSALSN